jgi:chemotaxis protein CheD
MADLMARMAEIASSGQAGDVLVGLGLGSCIGLALADDGGRAAALAHIVLPVSSEVGSIRPVAVAKFADTAVPALIREIVQLGVPARRIFAALVGGAQMFATGSGTDIGSRNERAVRDALAGHGIPVRAAVTGGSVGRTIRVYVGHGRITYREAGGREIDMLPGPVATRRAA